MSHDTRRLFFALWPDEVVRAGIVARRERLGPISRRRVPDRNLHLTLVFLGDQPAERLDMICAAADEIRFQSFELCLDRFGWFPGARVAWLGGEAPPGAVEMVEQLSESMVELGLSFDHRPFRPHVTLFRQVAQLPRAPDPEPLVWSVTGFSLIESIPGRPYRVLDSWFSN